jgi:hypothetical protein
MQCSQLWGTLRGFGLAGVPPMLRTCSRIIAVTAMVAAPSMTAQAADTTLTLACQGTTSDGMSENVKPEPVSMGIIVNFATRTVQGFGTPDWLDYPVKITGVNDVTVAFGGSRDIGQISMSIRGTIDRVTGDVGATETSINTKTHDYTSVTNYALKCRPTQRMF